MRGSDLTRVYVIHTLTVVNTLRKVGRCGGSEVKHDILFSFLRRPIVLCLKTSMNRHEPQGLIWFCPCMFFLSLKVVGPIDCHYMTDRPQQFELKIFVCVLMKKQSHLHLGCPGGK